MAKTTSKAAAAIVLPDPLPGIVTDCHTLIFQLYHRVQVLEKHARRRNRDDFGRSSAQTPADTLEGPGKELYDEIAAAIAAEEQIRGIDSSAKAHGGGGRKAPHSAKEETIENHKISDPAELLCPCCNVARTPMGFVVSYQLEHIPARYKRIKHVEFKYSCPKCKSNVIQASKPLQPIDKGYPGPALLAHVITSKLAHHLPLYRQERIFANLDVPIHRSTMSRWAKQAADELTVIYDRMRVLILQGRFIYADGTGMPFILKGSGKTQRGCIWFFGGDTQHPYKLYLFSEAETQEHPWKFLKGFKGFLLTDGTNKYNLVLESEEETRDGAISAKCWAHVYRMYEDAKRAEEKLADYAMGVIKSLFRIERFALTLCEKECVEIRGKYSKPILDRFKIWLDEQKDSGAPTSLTDAVKYTLNHGTALVQFVDNGFLKIHNNDSENALRPVVIGRNNWMFAGSASGGQASAVLTSLVQTCLALGINPEEYLTDVLIRLPGTPHTKIDHLLPDQWKALRDQAKMEPIVQPMSA